jgi:DNA-binding response OmpR family regulator
MEPRVLLIEDSSDDALLIQRAFRQIHPSVHLDILTNGEDAIAYLDGSGKFTNRAKHPLPDLVLLDLKIPRKSGLEVLAWLWDQATLNRLRVIVLTSSQCGQDIEQAFELDAESYLVKPSSFEELLGLVRKIDLFLLKSPRERKREVQRRLATVSAR